MNFSEELKKLRKEKGLTQKQVSEFLECPMRTYQHWENASRETPEYFQKLIIEKLKEYK